jgi:stage II sporulation protein AA (anti-sigma F factor antagonist)
MRDLDVDRWEGLTGDRGGPGHAPDDAIVHVAVEDGVTVLSVRGELDLETARATRTALLAALDRDGVAIVDLHAVTFLDSSGLRCLSDVVHAHPALTFRRVPEPVRRVLEITGLLGSFGLEPSA